MKAYRVTDTNEEYGDLLIYAEDRNSARITGTMFFDGEYIGMTATRAKAFDKYYREHKPRVVHSNRDLPEGAPKFYWDEPDITQDELE